MEDSDRAVAATGVLSYRAYDAAVLDPGSAGYAPWTASRERPGPAGLVGAAVCGEPPTPSPGGSSYDAIEFADPAGGTRSVDPFGRERDVGLGCAVGNLVLARARGACGRRSRCFPTATGTASRTSTSSRPRRAPSRSPR